MKQVLLFSLTLFLFSCHHPTPELSAQYDKCKQIIIDHQLDFVNHGDTQSKKDSLMQYVQDLKDNNLEKLLSKYDVGPEDEQTFVNSVCANAQVLDYDRLMDALSPADSSGTKTDSVGK
jgi:hypothetical protein